MGPTSAGSRKDLSVGQRAVGHLLHSAYLTISPPPVFPQSPDAAAGGLTLVLQYAAPADTVSESFPAAASSATLRQSTAPSQQAVCGRHAFLLPPFRYSLRSPSHHFSPKAPPSPPLLLFPMPHHMLSRTSQCRTRARMRISCLLLALSGWSETGLARTVSASQFVYRTPHPQCSMITTLGAYSSAHWTR